MRKLIGLMVVLLLHCTQAEAYHSQVGITEHPGVRLPLDLPFIDENGSKTTLGALMAGKPALLSMNYFTCAGICSPQLHHMASAIDKMSLRHDAFRVITVDFAEYETPAMAREKKKNITAAMKGFDPDTWHFVIGENNSSRRLAKLLGFGFQQVKTPSGKIGYRHPALLVAVSPNGVVTRYMRGIEQLPTDLEMALLGAAHEQVQPTIPKDSPFCFTDKPKGDVIVEKTEKTWAIVMTLLLVALFVYLYKTGKMRFRRDKDEA